MALHSLSLLVLVVVALQEGCFGSSSHSLKYFFTAISEPSQGLPHFVVVGFVDDQLLDHYDSHPRKVQPQESWMEKYGKKHPGFWDIYIKRGRLAEELFRMKLKTLSSNYNQSEGLHIWQCIFACELQSDGSKGGFHQYAYEGKTFITFDKETLTWVASVPQAQILQRQWDALRTQNQEIKSYLETECIVDLENYLSFMNETLLRTDPPVVTVSSKMEVEDGMETHVCRMDGFYPREIDVSWRRDGKVWLQDTLHGSVVPNGDGTYHYWLSIRIDPKERDRYRCHVEHDGLQDMNESNLWLIIGCIVAALVLVYLIAGIFRSNQAVSIPLAGDTPSRKKEE